MASGWVAASTAVLGNPSSFGAPVVTFGQRRTYRMIPTRANGQPALGMYTQDPHASLLHANGLMDLTLAGDKISAITSFDNSVLPRFGLPRTFPE